MTRDRKRGGHGFREGVLQALYLMVGLVIAFPIIYAFLFPLWSRPRYWQVV